MFGDGAVEAGGVLVRPRALGLLGGGDEQLEVACVQFGAGFGGPGLHEVLHRGRVVSRQELLSHLYDDDDETSSNVLEVHVAGLRRKLGPDSIGTRRGHGYIIDT